MRKIFEQFGAVILVVIVIVALISVNCLFFQGDGSGWMDGAFKGTTDEMVDTAGEAIDSINFPETNAAIKFLGKGQTVDVISATPLTFGATAPKANLQAVKVDGTTIDASNYTVEEDAEGNVVITLTKEYLETLGRGTHDLTFEFTTGNANGDFDVEQGYGPGLYDANDVLLASWDSLVNDYGMNAAGYYSDSTYKTATSSPYYVLNNNDELSTGVKLITGDDISTIGANSFRDCANLTTVVISDSVTAINGSAFMGCVGLTSVDIPDGLPIIGNKVFKNCTSLANIDIPDSVTKIGEYTFEGCTSLTSVTIPDSVTIIGNYAFSGCTNLTSVSVGDGVTSVGPNAFKNCTSLTSINIPDGVTVIDSNVFYGCESLTGITLHDGVTSIKLGAFNNSGLTSIVIPNSVTSIGDNVFAGCVKLTSVNIPNGVSSIGGDTFKNCASLTSITIPGSVTSIEENVFWGCTNLTSITFEGTVEQWNTITLGSFWNNVVPATEVQCSDGTVSLS